MKIVSYEIGHIESELITPFCTALRTTTCTNSIGLTVKTDEGLTAFGEAAGVTAVTGETNETITKALTEHIMPVLLNRDINDFEALLSDIAESCPHNGSAKAAADIALYDLVSKVEGLPLYKFLGGDNAVLETDLTISLGDIDKMLQDAVDAVARGFSSLKIKLGNDAALDIERISAIRNAVGNDILLRADANQGWTPEEAVRIIGQMEDRALNIELVEQPVKAHDIDGMAFVTQNTKTKILADESVFSPDDAKTIIERHAADLINIKLMKTGGIAGALKICQIAKTAGVECMLGCMLENSVSVTAACHLAAARKDVITRIDLDAPFLTKKAVPPTDAKFENGRITLASTPGLGIN